MWKNVKPGDLLVYSNLSNHHSSGLLVISVKVVKLNVIVLHVTMLMLWANYPTGSSKIYSTTKEATDLLVNGDWIRYAPNDQNIELR